MKQTNYYLFDFLDFDTNLDGKEVLWKACMPTNIETENADVLVTIPFQKQLCSNDISPDLSVPRKEYTLRLRAYGEKTLRVAVGFGVPAMPDSIMLDIDKNLQATPLQFEKNEEEWLVKDENGTIRARFSRTLPELDYWSDLLPKPEETLDVTFYPDGEKEVKISAYDQFFPARHDALALAFVEKDGVCNRTTMSFHSES